MSDLPRQAQASGALPIRIGARIRHRRVEAGLTLRELAALTGISEAQLRHFERGTLDVPASLICRLAFALDVSVGSLLPDVTTLKDVDGRVAVERELLRHFTRMANRDQRDALLGLVRAFVAEHDRSPSAASSQPMVH